MRGRGFLNAHRDVAIGRLPGRLVRADAGFSRWATAASMPP